MPSSQWADLTILATSWTDLLTGLDEGMRFSLIIVVIIFGWLFVLGLGGIIAGTLNSIHQRRVEAELKQDMLDRGMSAEEIATVIQASAGSSKFGAKKK